jgi:hypothetical protein
LQRFGKKVVDKRFIQRYNDGRKGGGTMAKPKVLSLRSRPQTIRYAYIAVGTTNIHIGLAYAGLKHAMINDYIVSVIVVDIEKQRNYTANPEHFLNWWKEHYLESGADYESERK